MILEVLFLRSRQMAGNTMVKNHRKLGVKCVTLGENCDRAAKHLPDGAPKHETSTSIVFTLLCCYIKENLPCKDTVFRGHL